ncbi:hypothetical protein EYR36_011542 [Pleurotus pulmonarius]|nr:hypothetical protein EYR36_011542 [Pleurotus pulmonarius]
MVHRSGNSLLLTNLISQETLYSSSLSSLLNTSHVSITLYEAYAASSSADVAQLVMSVVEAMRAIDDALRGYEEKVKEGREVLKGVEKLEEEVGNVARDRDILVNRLIKASKSTKRASIPHSNSSSSFPSPFSSTATSSKLNAAQAELQACEAHLTVKERELEKRRGDVVEQALMGRCRGIIECGQIWVERGQRALSVLEQASLTAREFIDSNNRRPLSLHSPFGPYKSPSAGASAQSHSSQPQPRQVHTPPLSTSGTGSAGSSKPLPQVIQYDISRLSYISSNASFVSLSQYSTSTAASSLAPSQSVSQVNGNDTTGGIGASSSAAPDHQDNRGETEASPRFPSPLSSSHTPFPAHSPALLPLPPPSADIVDINAPRPNSQHIYSNAEFLDVGGSINSHATTTTETGETTTTRTNTQDHTAGNVNEVQHPHFRQPSPVQHLQHHLNIPPAHAISELALPTSMSLPSFTPATNTSTPSLPVTPTSRWLLGGRRDSWRERRESWSHGSGVKRSYLTESEGRRGASEGVFAVGGSAGVEASQGAGASNSRVRVNDSEEPPERGEVEEDSSDDEVQDARVVVVENPRFATGKSSKKANETNGLGIGRRNGGGMSPAKRERRTSMGMGFFGSIRGLFTHGSPTKDSSPGKAHSHQGDQRRSGDHADDDEKEEGGGGFFRRGSRRGGKWETRTNDNLKDMMRKGKGRDSDSDTGGGRALGEMFASPSRSSMQTVTAHNTPGSSPPFASGGVGAGGTTIRRPSMNGSTSTLGASGSPSGARNKLRKGQGKKAKKRRASQDDANTQGGGGGGDSKDDSNRGVATKGQNEAGGSPKRTLSMKRPATVLQVTPLPTKLPASATPPHSSPTPRNHPSGGGGGGVQGDLQRKASLSSAMSVPIISTLGLPSSNLGPGKGHRRASSVGHGPGAASHTPTQAYGGARGSVDEGMTLLTIVEDMARLNRMASANRGRGGLTGDGKTVGGGPNVTAASSGQTLTRSKSRSHSNMPSVSSSASSPLSSGLAGLMDIKAPPSVGRRELENELAGNTERQSPNHTKSPNHSPRTNAVPPKSQSPRQGDISKRSLTSPNTNGNAATPFTIPQAPGSVLPTPPASSTSKPQVVASSSIASALAFPPRSSSPLASTSITMHSESPRGSLDSGLSGGSAVGRSRPAKSPLKSALKQSSSRSPSPLTSNRHMPSSTSAVGGSFAANGSGTGAAVGLSQGGGKPDSRNLEEGNRIAARGERKRSLKGKGRGKAKAVDPNIINDGDQEDSDSDSASYETVHEALTADEESDSDGGDNEPSYRPTTGAELPNIEVPHIDPHSGIPARYTLQKDSTPKISAANGRPVVAMSDISSASASTTTMNSSPSPHSHKALPPLGPDSKTADAAASPEAEEKVQRRKSVRVSLKPSYAAPPVVDDDEDEEADGGHQEDSGNNGEVIDMWKDSSDEDLEYERAKKRLSRAVLPFSCSTANSDLRATFTRLPSQTYTNSLKEMSDQEQNPPPQDEVKTEDSNATINIKVASSTGEEIFFKIKRSTKLSKLQGAYANKVGKDVGSIRFLYEGERINNDDTPASLDMEDNDTIDVMRLAAVDG